MRRYVLGRLLGSVPVVAGVVTIVFLLLHMIPGDPVDLMLGESAVPAQREELRAKLHLNEPLAKQYVRYLAGVVTLDFGTSIQTGEPVGRRIAKRFPSTLLLASAALLIALGIAVPSGLVAAVRRGTLTDTAVMTVTLVGLSLPAFWLGPMLVLLFAFHLGWFPISGAQEPLSVVLPALTLGTGMAALTARMTRSTVAEVLKEDFIRTARAKGVGPRRILLRHALRNALLPLLTITGLQAASLLAGAIITEKVFSWPGIGLLLMDAIEKRDYPLVQGCTLAIALCYIGVNLLTDLAYGLADPRVRLGKGRA